VVILLDGDEAGRRGAQEIAARFGAQHVGTLGGSAGGQAAKMSSQLTSCGHCWGHYNHRQNFSGQSQETARLSLSRPFSRARTDNTGGAREHPKSADR
jgi:hypothetical protein